MTALNIGPSLLIKGQNSEMKITKALITELVGPVEKWIRALGMKLNTKTEVAQTYSW